MNNIVLNQFISVKWGIQANTVYIYTPHEGPSLPNQNTRKLGVLAGRWRESTPHFIVILINIRENVTIMFKACIIH